MTGTIPLGELIAIRGGGTPSRSISAYWNGEIRWATVKDFKSTELAETEESITPEGVNASATNVIPAGSVIVPTRMAVGKAAINTIDLAINQDLKALLPGSEVDSRFLLYFILAQGKYLESQAQGATVKGIKLDLLRSLPFPKIPPSEQRRIATILDKADAIRRKREQALALADDFLRSLFMEMFGDPASNSRGWPITLLDELGDVQGGLQVSTKREAGVLTLPYLRVANVYRDRLELADIKEINLTEAEFRRVRLQVGDILIVEGHGNPEEIGRAAIWDGSIEPCVHQNHLIRFRADRRRALPEYISRLLNSDGGRQQLIGAGRTTSGLNTISTRKVKEVRIPLPPIELQQKFFEVVRAQLAITGKLSAQLELSKGLISSLSHRAFRGEL